MSNLSSLVAPPLAAVACLVALAAAWDLATSRIPNWLTLGAAVAGLAWQAAAGGWQGALAGAAGWGVGVALLLLPWIRGGMGAGDAKLMGAVGAWVGPKACLVAFLGTALVGGVAAAALLAWSGRAGAAGSPRLRYGAAIAVGSLGALLLGERLPEPFSVTF